MLSRNALIVDDERDIRELLGMALGRMGLRVETAGDLAAARNRLAAGHFDVCITDLRLPDGNGLQLVEHIVARHPGTPVAMMTAYGNIEAAVAALKAGAFDFVTKPVDLTVLRQLVSHALDLGVQRRFIVPASSPWLLGDSSAMRQLRDTVARLARSQAPVLFCGEPGVGKELLARLVHAQSPRRDAAFVTVDCASLVAGRLESELFPAAQGGSLFLDGIAELPPPLQAGLLRVIQEKALRPAGATAALPVDVRILSATHQNLARQVEAGRFRQDLLQRIQVIALPVPPLRERREDIPLIAEAVLARLAKEQGRALALADDAHAALAAHAFPGNVRELETLLERAAALADGPVIHAAELGLAPSGSPAAPATADPGPNEREALIAALDAHRWHRTKTAEALGITFRALRYKLKKYGIE